MNELLRIRLRRALLVSTIGVAVLPLTARSPAAETAPEMYLRLLTELRAHQKEFDWPSVTSVLEKLVAANPTEPRHWWDLGVARARTEQYRTAIEAFRRADALGCGFDWDPVIITPRGEALYQIACCEAQLGEHEAALSTLDQALAAGLRRPKRLLTESRLESLRDHPRLRDMAGAINTSDMSRDEGYRADLKFLAREMFRLHFNPYHVNDRAKFEAAIQSLDAEIPKLSEPEILVRFQQIVALLGDGHSALQIRSAHVLPVRFYWFDDGVFIVDVKRGNERLLGAQVLAVNGHSTEAVLKAFEPIVSRDNEMNLRSSTPRMWRAAELLVGLGLAQDTGGASLTVRLVSGSEETVQLSTEPYRDQQEDGDRWISIPPGDTPLPLSWQNRDKMLWFEPTADGRVLYAGINGMGNPRGETFKAFTQRLFQYAEEHPAIDRLVLDFRRNGGGDTFLNRPLVQGLVRSRFNHPGGLAVLIGRETFSAAQNTITEIERHTEAVFIGEPSGSRPNFIGESVPFSLPYSNQNVTISDLYWVTSSPLDRRMWIAPRIYLPPRSADFLARRDPALDEAVHGQLVAPPPGERQTVVAALDEAAKDGRFASLLEDGADLKNWVVTDWSDLAKAAPAEARWKIENGVLHGSNPRGTWLVSKAEYGDFVLEFEWKLGERGNSGVALRTPLQGDPAFDGLEVQMVDPRYHPADQKPQANELTGSFYRAIAPREQVFKPTDWNKYVITCRGPRIEIVLNGKKIQDVNLDEQTFQPARHDGTLAPPLKDRPRRGHVGFQELSRGGGHVEIRHVRLRELP